MMALFDGKLVLHIKWYNIKLITGLTYVQASHNIYSLFKMFSPYHYVQYNTLPSFFFAHMLLFLLFHLSF